MAAVNAKTGVNKALIVDDEASIRDILVGFFESFGFEAVAAADGEEALKLYSDQTFDIVISDMMMPKMTGMELLQEIKQIDPNVIFILITGYPSMESAIEFIKKGARDYITKPFNIDEIKIKVDRALLERNLQGMVRSSRGLMWGLILSIPVWLVLGIIFAKLMLK
jgi:two-component system, NtrC family, response regulator PilR